MKKFIFIIITVVLFCISCKSSVTSPIDIDNTDFIDSEYQYMDYRVFRNGNQSIDSESIEDGYSEPVTFKITNDYIIINRNNVLDGVMPIYISDISTGEYDVLDSCRIEWLNDDGYIKLIRNNESSKIYIEPRVEYIQIIKGCEEFSCCDIVVRWKKESDYEELIKEMHLQKL